ncbi:hypothetical protein ACJX0J_029601 [Zea mays]
MVWDRIYASLNMSLFITIFPSIKWARKTYGNLPVNVVGHSIGGDLASFCALGLFVSIFNVLDLLYQISIYALQITCTCFMHTFPRLARYISVYLFWTFISYRVYGMSVADHLEGICHS